MVAQFLIVISLQITGFICLVLLIFLSFFSSFLFSFRTSLIHNGETSEETCQFLLLLWEPSWLWRMFSATIMPWKAEECQHYGFLYLWFIYCIYMELGIQSIRFINFTIIFCQICWSVSNYFVSIAVLVLFSFLARWIIFLLRYVTYLMLLFHFYYGFIFYYLILRWNCFLSLYGYH